MSLWDTPFYVVLSTITTGQVITGALIWALVALLVRMLKARAKARDR